MKFVKLMRIISLQAVFSLVSIILLGSTGQLQALSGLGGPCNSSNDCASTYVCDTPTIGQPGTCQACVPGSLAPINPATRYPGGDIGCTGNTDGLGDVNNCCGIWGCTNISAAGLPAGIGICGPTLNEVTNVGVPLAVLAVAGILYFVFRTPAGEVRVIPTGAAVADASTAAGATQVAADAGYDKNVGFSNGQVTLVVSAVQVAATNPPTGTANATYVPVGSNPEPTGMPADVAQVVNAMSGGGQSGPSATIIAATEDYVTTTLAPAAKKALSFNPKRNFNSIQDALAADSSGQLVRLLVTQNVYLADADNFKAAIAETSSSSEFGNPTFTEAATTSAAEAQPGDLLKAVVASNFIQGISVTGQLYGRQLTAVRINKNVAAALSYLKSNNTRALQLIINLGELNFELNSDNLNNPDNAIMIAQGVERMYQVFNQSGFSTDANGFPLDGSLNFFSA